MRTNKLSKFIVSMLALAVVLGATIFVSSGKVLADGDGYIPEGFVLDETDGWYKKTISHTSYKLLNQNIINSKCGGGLPSDGSFDQGRYDYFYVAENLVITKGISIDNGYRIWLDLNGHTISYEPLDSELDVCLYRSTPSEDKTYGSYLYIMSTGERGTIRSPKGAPLFAIGSCNLNRSCEINLYDVIVEGNAQGYDPNGNRAITIEKNGECNLQNTTFRNFSAKQGGVIYYPAYDYVYPDSGTLIHKSPISLGYYTTFENCYADEGGVVYAETSVDCQSATMKNNVAQTRGGAICVVGTDNTVELGDCTITGNHCVASAGATTGGGAIYCGSTNSSKYAIDCGWTPEARIIDNTCGNNVPNNIYFPNSSKYDILFFQKNYVGSETFKIGISRYSISDMDYIAYSDDTYTFSDETIPQVVYDDPAYSLIGWEKLTPNDGKVYYRYLRIIKDNQSNDPIFLKGFSLVLSDYELKVKMSVYVPDLANYSSSNWSADLRAQEGSNFYATNGSLTCEETSIENGIVSFTFLYDPTDMTVPLDLTVLRDNEQVLNAGGFTLRDYALAILKNPEKYSDGDAAVATALVNYGAASQKYFDFRENDLADSILSSYPDLKNDIDNYDMSMFYQYPISFTVNNKDGDITCYSMSAIFGGSPSLKLYFKVKDGVVPFFGGYDYDIYAIKEYASKNRGNGVYTVTLKGTGITVCAYDSTKLPDEYDYDYFYSNYSSYASVYLSNYLRSMYQSGSTTEMRELAKGLLVFQEVVVTKEL